MEEGETWTRLVSFRMSTLLSPIGEIKEAIRVGRMTESSTSQKRRNVLFMTGHKIHVITLCGDFEIER